MKDMVDNWSREILEFDKILELVSFFTLSFEAKDKIYNTVFYKNSKTLLEQQKYINQIKDILTASETSFSGTPEIEKEVTLLQKQGNLLDGFQLIKMADFFIQASKILSFFKSAAVEGPLTELCDTEDLSFISTEIYKHFADDGQINPELPDVKKVYKRINEFQQKNDSLIKHYTREWQDILQMEAPSFKDNRIVFPVKAAYKKKAKGVIHQVSQTGSTLFIEPFELLENNNNLIEAKNELEQLILKYCRLMTTILHEQHTEIARYHHSFIFFDCLYARACFSIKYDCIFPEFSKENLKLLQSRHLLLKEKAIPVDLIITDPVKAIVITGSNAGGKTVSLKTLGLSVLMNQAAIPIPVIEGSTMPVFSFLAADIGDSQSLEESRSTFTGHIFRIKNIIEKQLSGGMILLDELGTGTSDDEGGALGIAMLKNIIKSKNMIASTSHNKKINEFAFQHPAFDIASVRYNDEKSRPEFGINYGIFGLSHGIDTAVYCGMPASVIEDAKEILNSTKTDFEHSLDKIKTLEENILKKEIQLQEQKHLLETKIKEAEDEKLKLKKEKQSFQEKIEELIIETNRNIDTLRNQDVKISKKAEKDIKSALYDHKDQSIEFDTPENLKLCQGEYLQKGNEVIIMPENNIGTLIRKEKNNSWQIQAGLLKINKTVDLLYMPPVTVDKKPSIEVDRGMHVENAKHEIDLRGYTIEQAWAEVDKQIDTMIVTKQSMLSIIHGFGPLEKWLTDYMKSHNAVKEIKYASQSSGGRGRSIITLSNSN